MKQIPRRRTVLIVILLLSLASVVWWHYYSNAFLALPYNDSMDYASIGRNIALDRGITSQYLTPLSLVHAGEPYPNIWRAPLWPISLGGFFTVFGSNDTVAAAASAIFYFLALLPFYFLARRWVGEDTAVLCCILYIFSPTVLYFSISGMTEPAALFFMLLWIYLLVKAPQKRWPYFLLPGVVGGLFYLLRYNFIIFLPLSCLFLWYQLSRGDSSEKSYVNYSSSSGYGSSSYNKRGSARGRSIVFGQRLAAISSYLGGWLLTVSPWLWRNYSIAGNPFFSLQSYEPAMFTEKYPEYTLYMLPEAIDVKGFVLQNFDQLLIKIGEGLIQFGEDLLDPSFSGTAVLLVLFFFLGPLHPRKRGINTFILLCFGAQLAALLVVHYIPRLFFIFIPFYLIISFSLLEHIFSRLKIPYLKTVLLAAITVTIIFTYPPQWHEDNSWFKWEEDFSSPIEDVQQFISPQGAVISNDGHILSWHADRLAVKIPVQVDQIERITELAPVEGILLTYRMLHGNTPEADPEWKEIIEKKPEKIGDFRLFSEYSCGSVFYLRIPEAPAHVID